MQKYTWYISALYDKEENKPIKQLCPELYVANTTDLEYTKYLSTIHILSHALLLLNHI